jgi:hypothetical protein
MRKLTLKLLLLSIIISLSIFILNKVYINDSISYDYSGGMLIDKHQLAEKTASPKILIIGGSSGSFGINSTMLKEKLQLPVVNMSFIAPFGTYFLFNDALKEVKKVDIIFITLEYDIKHLGYENEILTAADYYPNASNYIVNRENILLNLEDNFKHKVKNVRQFFLNLIKPDFRKTAKVSDSSSVYFRGAFSENGDIISQLNNPPKVVDYHKFSTEYVDFSEQIMDLNIFAEKAKLKGAEVYFIYPPLAESTFNFGKKAVFSISQQIEKDIHCKILGNEYDFVMPDSMFFDSFFHLNYRGRDIRTNKIISLYNQNKI